MTGGNFESDNDDYDPQDQAEAFDESMTVGGEGSAAMGGDSPLGIGEDMRTFEELPEVEDLTQLIGDRDEDEALALDSADFDPDAIDDADLEEDDELDYRAADAEREDDVDGLGEDDGFDEARIAASEIEGLDEVRDADEAEGGEDDTTDYAARTLDDDDLRELGYQGPQG